MYASVVEKREAELFRPDLSLFFRLESAQSASTDNDAAATRTLYWRIFCTVARREFETPLVPAAGSRKSPPAFRTRLTLFTIHTCREYSIICELKVRVGRLSELSLRKQQQFQVIVSL